MIERFEVGSRMSQAVVYPAAARIATFAGQVGATPGADTGTQTAEVLAKIDRLLELVGASRRQITVATIWLRDIADFDAMNAVWDEWVEPGHTPARACVEARLAHPGLKVEIQVTVVLDEAMK